jgi:hypothetical protein
MGNVPTDHTSHTRAALHTDTAQSTVGCTVRQLHTSLRMYHTVMPLWRFIVTIIRDQNRTVVEGSTRPPNGRGCWLYNVWAGPVNRTKRRQDAAQVSRASMQTFKGGAYPALFLTFIPFNGGWTPGLPSLTENGYLWLPTFAGWRPLAAYP